jgi:ribonuclease BN (tRNA processing enzyme)
VVHIFLSHLHHDHIEGLRFFSPAYSPEWRCNIYGPAGSSADGMGRLLARMMSPRLFPVSLAQMGARIFVHGLKPRQRIELAGPPATEVVARFSRAHPKTGVTMYRVESGGRAVVYATDIEAPKGGHTDVVAFSRGADVLIHDAQYSDDEYFGGHLNKAGWGHSTARMAAEAARDAGVGQLILYHHDPEHDDAEVHRLEALARRIFPRSRAATEGLQIELPRRATSPPGRTASARRRGGARDGLPSR